MSTAAGRVICPRCGENNFSTQANCWKCQSPLSGAAASLNQGNSAVSPRLPQPAPSGVAAPLPHIGNATRFVDPAVAFWAAIALAFFFPTIAVPIGIIFLMLDDRRRIEIGKIALIWGLVFSVVQFLVMGWIYSAALAQLKGFLPMAGQLSSAAQQGQSPNLNGKVPPLTIPGEQPATSTDNVAFPEPPR